MSNENKGLIYTNDSCIGCNKCIKRCPILGANIAYTENGRPLIRVDGDKCIHCGSCLKTCEHSARNIRDDFASLLFALKNGEEIDLLVAPSFFLNFEATYPQMLGFLKSLGFKHIYDVSIGANLCTWAYLAYIKEHNCHAMISSACPAVVDYIEKYQPELLDRLMPIQSPVHCLRTYLSKQPENAKRKYAFLCPCIGKQGELSSYTDGYRLDYVVTFHSLLKYIRENNVKQEEYYAKCDELLYPGSGAFYPIPGGLKQNINYFFGDKEYIRQVEGPSRAYNYLRYFSKQLKENGALPFFVDILNCPGGCTEGVASDSGMDDFELLEIKLHENKDFRENSTNDVVFAAMESPAERFAQLDHRVRDDFGLCLDDFKRTYNTNAAIREDEVTFETIDRIFHSMHKETDDDRNINCSSCGYKSCRDMAVAIAHGYNRPENCVHYMKDTLEADRKSLEMLLAQINGPESTGGEMLDSEHIVQNLSKAINEIETARENLDNEVHVKSQFYAGITHELRTPLNAIISISGLLEKNDLSPELSNHIESIKSAGTNLLETVNELLDISKMEAGHFSIIKCKYQFIPFINEISNLMRFRAIDKKIDFNTNIDPSVPSELIGDAKRIRQILLNLLGNAIKYTPYGHVSLTVSWNNDTAHPMMKFDVTDSGIGIKEEDIPYLFDAYRQADEEKNHHIEGTGLGLKICHDLAAEMDAKITVTSVYGEGSTFSLCIPQALDDYVPVSDSESRRTPKAVSEDLPLCIPRAKILVVDDLSVNLQIAGMYLDSYMCDFKFAESGEAACELVKNNKFDVILMDYRMPIMDGLQTLERIRAIEQEKGQSQVPIVVMSAEDEECFKSTEAAKRFNGFLPKPIVEKRLKESLLSLIPPQKVITGDLFVLPQKGVFSASVSDKDYDSYLEAVCILERIAAKRNDDQITHMCKSHRKAIQEGRLQFIESNAEFLDIQLEMMR